MKLAIYNICAEDKYNLSINELQNLGLGLVDDYPMKNPLWYPSGKSNQNKFIYFVKFLFFQLIPALLVDLIVKQLGHKPL